MKINVRLSETHIVHVIFGAQNINFFKNIKIYINLFVLKIYPPDEKSRSE